MSPNFPWRRAQRRAPALPGLALALALAGTVAGASAKAAPPSSGATNAAAAGPVIPLSVFTQPASREYGRDPFYPNSTRLFAMPVPSNIQATKVVLELQGIAGSPPNRLALINGHTFKAGEEDEVLFTGGRKRIHVLEIQDEAALVEYDGQRELLHLKGAKVLR